MSQYDRRPKRRRHRDNPYVLESIKEDGIYKVMFSGPNDKKYEVDISEKVYNELNRFELDDLKELNEFDRHTEHIEKNDEMLYKLSSIKQESIEDYIIRKSTYKDLKEAINKLSDIQSRRIKMYYFDEYSSKEIAILENCTPHSVRVSIRKSLVQLKELLERIDL